MGDLKTCPTNIDYESFISKRCRLYKPAAIRGLFPYEEIPGMISLLAGKPNAETFPFESLQLTLKSLNGESTKLTIDGPDLVAGLQYGATAGMPRLVKWLTDLVRHVHLQGQSREDWRVSLGSGSQDCMYKAFQALLDEGDTILLECPTYAGTIGIIRGMVGVETVSIDSDEEGIRPESFERVVANWPKSKKFPKLVYTCPFGGNPTGTSAGRDRRLAILKLVKQYNLILVEDDAYYFNYYGHTEQAPSYFSLEAEANGEVGRVVRFDSFSKIVSSGLRIGYTTGPKPILAAMDLITANTNLQVCSTAQAVALSLLEHWGIDQFLAHTKRVAQFYEKQRDMAHELAQKHLKGLVSYNLPTAGMFLWLKLLNMPENLDTTDLLMTKGIEAGFLACPGKGFYADPVKSPYVRISFSLCDRETLDEAFKRLASLVKAAQIP